MQTIREFMASKETYSLPAPGGAVMTGAPRTNDDADLYLAAVAAHIKERGLDADESISYLYMKIGQVERQLHYSAAADVKIIERLGSWAREFMN